MDLKGRLRNYGLWVSVASLLGIVLKHIGVIHPNDPSWDTATTALLSILVTLGLVSNPTTDHPWYSDDKPKDIPTDNNGAPV